MGSQGWKEDLEKVLSDWGIRPPSNFFSQLEIYLQEILAYSRRVRLTASEDPREIALRHFADALAPLSWLKERFPQGTALLDLGSGAGFVGLTLKLAWPDCPVVLLESSRKKHAFLDWMISRLKLKETQALWARAEGKARLQPFRDYEVALERALAPLPLALEWGTPWVRAEGYFLAFQGSREVPRREAGEEKSPLIFAGTIPYVIRGIGFEGQIFIYRKRENRCI